MTTKLKEMELSGQVSKMFPREEYRGHPIVIMIVRGLGIAYVDLTGDTSNPDLIFFNAKGKKFETIQQARTAARKQIDALKGGQS